MTVLDFDKLRNGIIHVGEQKGNNEPPKWLGSGFLVDTQCTFATAKHLLANAARDAIVIRFQLPHDLGKVKTIRARVLFEFPDRDLLFLRIDRVDGNRCQSGNLNPLQLSDRAPDTKLVGQDIAIIGFPLITSASNLDIPILRVGVISATEITLENARVILLDLHEVPGFSGSPVILKATAQVVGVVFGPGPTERLYGFEWATAITETDYRKALAEGPQEPPQQ